MLEEKRTIYAGARFITLDESRPEVECLCVMGGRIECLGSREEVLAVIAEEQPLGGAPRAVARRVQARVRGWTTGEVYAILPRVK